MTQKKKYIWQHPSWPEFRWDHAALLEPLGKCRFQQGALLTQMKELGIDLKQQAQTEILIQEAIKTSEIEGERLDLNAVRSSVARRLGISTAVVPSIRNQQAEGIVDILLDATMNYRNDLTQERMFAWHASLFPTGYSGLNKIRVDSWRDDRNGPMRVVPGPIGREKIHYEAPPADRLTGEMNEFMHWWEISRSQMDGLIRAAVGHLRFVIIHPFEDGNGRIARALTEMALAQDENLPNRFYSLSAQIMAERDSYYQILEHTSTSDGDITGWIKWFLECMSRAILDSGELLFNVMLKARFWQHYAQIGLKDRQSKIVNRLLEAGPGGFEGGLTNRKYAAMGHVSKATAQRELADLLQKGILRLSMGRGRSTSYDLCWEDFRGSAE
ncbi:MAG: Fic family protein [Desulfobacterales bacterium]|jgi:Fic family protein|nr:Fic family protein [Desulfobacterales bacterium]